MSFSLFYSVPAAKTYTLSRWGIFDTTYKKLRGHLHEPGPILFSSKIEAESELRTHPWPDTIIVKVKLSYVA